MQMQADLLGVPVVRPRVPESTALGAAGLAGLAVGFWSSLDEFGAQWQAERTFEPAWPADVREARMQRWRQAVELSKGWSRPAVGHA
ncbi:glycerol kinase domain protein [Bordetella bronchiseptica A1-7]|nr:glycerol kinase domain protein [Bordetella bronchiseptica A1-7]